MAAGDARIASVRATRSAVRQNAAALGSALANHYAPPPNQGAGQPHETIQHAVTRMRGQGYSDAQIHGELTNHWGYSKADADRLVFGAPVSTAPAPLNTKPAPMPTPHYSGHSGDLGTVGKILKTGLANVVDPLSQIPGAQHIDQAVHDAVQTQLTRMGVNAASVMHGHGGFDVARASRHIVVRGGKIQLTGTPQQQREAAGLLSFQGTGNALQKAGQDLLGLPIGMIGVAANPAQGIPAFVKGTAKYYSTNPLTNLHQDPFMFGLNYVLPALSAGGSLVGRAGALAETAHALSPNADLSLADIARLRERGALQHYVQHGELPQASAGTKAGLLARAALRTPVARERTFNVGGQEFSAPSSHNHIVNLFHRSVTDRLIAHALDNGHDILGARTKVGRMIRSNLRVTGAMRNADLSRIAKAAKGLSAAQEHAAFILSKGVTAEEYARFHQAGLDNAASEEAAANHENGLALTRIASKYLEPGAEDPKVLRLASVLRDAIQHREEFYGKTDSQINHAIGSHYYGIHTRANGLPDLHAELAQIEEQHGPYAASAREHLDQEIANLQRFRAQSGPEHAAAIDAELAHLKTLADDVQFTQHRIAQLDQRIHELGPEQYRGRLTAHPDRLGATHRELLLQRAKLNDHLETLLAHARAREIHGMFESKGSELRGNVQPSAARTQLLEAAQQHGIDPRVAARLLDARALRWARETGGSTRDFYEEYLHAVHEGGDVPDAALFEVGPIHQFPAKREAQARSQYEKAGAPEYGNRTIRDEHGNVILGPITPEEWVQRTVHAVPSATLRDDLARWYESFEPIFRQAFGEDADAIMRGFAVSQANQSPAGGVTATLRVFDKIRRGETVTENEISTVAPAIAKAVQGHELLERGLGQKLSDFTDSLRGLAERTITGHSPEHGAPTAIDIHAARDLGYVDPRLVARLEERGLVHGKDFVVDNPPGSPAGIAYERMLKQYQEITDHLNVIGFDGRHDWTPAQVQALGWSAIQRFHGTTPEDLAFALDRNTYEIPYEVGNGMEGSRELPAQYSAALKVTKAEEPTIRSIIESNGAYVRGFHYGPGGYEGDINAAGVMRVIASPEQADRIAKTLADHYRQWEVWATRVGVGGSGKGFRSALEIETPAFKSKATVEKFWKAFREALPADLKDKAVGFTPYRRGDTYGIRVITSHPAAFKDGVSSFADRYHPVVEAAEKAAGVDVEWAHNNVEVRRHSGEVPGDQGAGAAEGSGPAEAGVGDHPDAEASGEALHEEVGGRVRGAYNPATREVSIGEHATADTFAHESLHAIRPSLDTAQLRSLEQHYGVVNGEWTRAHEERFVADMMRAARGEQVDPVVQSVFNASLVAPPEAFYLPFERETKPSRSVGGYVGKSPGPMGYGPAAREATHEFTGRILDEGGFRTKASDLASRSYSKARHWQNMQDLHAMLWALSKDTPELAGRGRLHGEPIPIRDIRQVPDSLKEEAYAVYPGNVLEGEAPDEIAKRLMEEWTAPPKHGEHVRWVNADFVRPLQPQSAGAALRFINGINNAFRFGRYLNPGYAKWLPQNLVLNLTQQGPLLFRNAAKMMTELQRLDPAVYHQIAEAVSFGSARALESEGAAAKVAGMQHSIAQAWAHINDHVPRMLAWLHEAQRAGYRTAADWETLMTDPRLRAQADAIIQRANKEAIDYGAMTPRERVYLKSLFAYWPWIRAASMWALRFPFEHPYQMAAYQEFSREGEKRVEDMFAAHGGIAPPYMEGYFPAKSGPIDLSAMNPWSQLAEDAQAVAGLTQGRPEEAGQAFGMMSPSAKPLVEVLTGRDQFGNVPKAGVLADAANNMAKTFEPFNVYRTATDQQTGATPKGPMAAVLKWLGDPQEPGFDYSKSAQNALKDTSNETRMRFKLREDPNPISTFEKQTAIRVAQIKDQTKSKSPQQDRALYAVEAAYGGMSLAAVNAALVQNKLRPLSPGDVAAERARIKSITP